MTLPRRLIGLDEPQETRVFLLMSAFGIAVGIVYWFLAYEVAGTILLLGFGVATGAIGLRLVLDPAARRVRGVAAERARPAGDAPGGGTGGIDRLFADETGRLPTETIAPFAVGLGVAVAATALIFGPAPLIVGVLPIGWGAASWLRSARAELDATELSATELSATELSATEPATTPRDATVGRRAVKRAPAAPTKGRRARRTRPEI